MSAVYFLGAKCINSKKSGKEFFPATFLTKNNWGDWSVSTKFCDSRQVFLDLVENVDVGAPVVCTLGMNGELLQAVQHDSFPALELVDDDM